MLVTYSECYYSNNKEFGVDRTMGGIPAFEVGARTSRARMSRARTSRADVSAGSCCLCAASVCGSALQRTACCRADCVLNERMNPAAGHLLLRLQLQPKQQALRPPAPQQAHALRYPSSSRRPTGTLVALAYRAAPALACSVFQRTHYTVPHYSPMLFQECLQGAAPLTNSIVLPCAVPVPSLQHSPTLCCAFPFGTPSMTKLP